MEARGARTFDGLIAAEPVTAARFPGHEVALVRNFPILDELVSGADRPFSERGNHVAYVGSMTAVRGIREVVQAVGRLPGIWRRVWNWGARFTPPLFRESSKRCPAGSAWTAWAG